MAGPEDMSELDEASLGLGPPLLLRQRLPTRMPHWPRHCPVLASSAPSSP